MTPLIKMRTTAELLNVCEGTVRNLVRRGELHPVRFGGSVRFRKSELARLIDGDDAANGADETTS